jgi:hypothetical protein
MEKFARITLLQHSQKIIEENVKSPPTNNMNNVVRAIGLLITLRRFTSLIPDYCTIPLDSHAGEERHIFFLQAMC